MQASQVANSAFRSLDGLVTRNSQGNTDISTGARNSQCHFPPQRAGLKGGAARKGHLYLFLRGFILGKECCFIFESLLLLNYCPMLYYVC